MIAVACPPRSRAPRAWVLADPCEACGGRASVASCDLCGRQICSGCTEDCLGYRVCPDCYEDATDA